MYTLITGSTSDLGKEIAIKFAKNNNNLILHYYTKEKEVNELKNLLETTYNINCITIKCNLENEYEIDNMINQIKKLKIINIINNAAIDNTTLLKDKNKDIFNKVLNINLIAPFLIINKLYKYMEKGTIINVSSNNSINTSCPESLEYDASKAGLNSLTKNLAYTLSPNIRVNAVAPGIIKTNNMFEDKEIENLFIKEETKKISLNRFANPSEIANLIYFLTSSEASYITGEIIKIDGGYHG